MCQEFYPQGGGVYPSMHWSRHPPRKTLPWQTPPCPVHAGIHIPPTAIAADGTHPTGMHSCLFNSNIRFLPANSSSTVTVLIPTVPWHTWRHNMLIPLIYAFDLFDVQQQLTIVSQTVSVYAISSLSYFSILYNFIQCHAKDIVKFV